MYAGALGTSASTMRNSSGRALRRVPAIVILATIGQAGCASDPRADPAEQAAGAVRVTPAFESTPASRLTSSFNRIVLDDRVTRAHGLDVAADGRVYLIEREGAIKVWDPIDRVTRMVGFIPAHAVHTSGLLGIALDPDFLDNGEVYFYYSPHNDTENVLARYTIRDGRLIPESRQVILEVPLQRQVEGGHSAGSLAFGPDGSLFLAVGDNTSPRGHGFGPIDEREGREIYDAQRASGNTWDLRGKILRIVPQDDGSYRIPAGNLFPHGSRGRPEIYVMGARNPFRISVDPATGWLYWGDVGPDAGMDDPERGPAGQDEFNQAREAGNFGWPYFVGDNQAYRDYDFAGEESGGLFDATLPINDSPNNTGARVLPPARPAMIWYPYAATPRFPTLGTGGRAAMAGPVYRYDERAAGAGALPETFDGSLFAFEFMRNWIQEVRFDERGNLTSVQPFLEEMDFVRPMAMDVGPDGALYLIEWGTSYEGWNNDDARLVRIEYVGAGRGSGTTIDSAAAHAPIRRASVGERVAGELRFDWPLDGGIFDFDRPIPYSVASPGGGAPGRDVRARSLLGHDSHTHAGGIAQGSEGTIEISRDESHLYLEDHFGALEAWSGAPDGGDPQARVRLQPRRMEAEHAYAFVGATRRVLGSLRQRIDVRVLLRVGDGGHARYGPVNLKNIDAINLSIVPGSGGEIEVRIDDPAGPVVARVSIPAADQPSQPGTPEQPAKLFRAPITDPGGLHDLYLVFRGSGDLTLFEVDWLEFQGAGMMQAP
jgi:glucose/arabinose dehydrogenase